MARSDLDKYGLLNIWPRVMAESVWRYNQIIGEGVEDAPDATRHTPYIQRERDMIASASSDAAHSAWLHLGFPPVPVWCEPATLTLNSDRAWDRQDCELPDGHIQAIGRRAVTSLGSYVVNYSDTNNDLILDQGQVTVTLSGGDTALDESELFLFFRVADGAISAANETWKIHPVTVTRTGNNVTFTAHKSMFTAPAIWGKEYAGQVGTSARNAGRPQNAEDFVSSVDVYRVYSDPTSAVQLISSNSETGQEITNVGASLIDPLNGIIRLYKGSSNDFPTNRPHAVRVYYKAGLGTDNPLSQSLITAIFRYGNVLMPQAPSIYDRTLAMWTWDREISKEVVTGDARNPPPFGITIGGMHLWKTIRPEGFRLPLKSKYVHMS